MSSSPKRTKSKFNLGSILYTTGVLIFTVSFVVVMTTISPAIKQEVSYDLKPKTTPSEITPIDSDFGIVIPKINANARVIPNVNPFNPVEYQQALSQGVAQAKGTALPGQTGNIFLFSHSSVDFWQATRYNSIFYLLDKLEKGDKISLYYQGTKFDYIVQSKKIVGANEVSYLKTIISEKKLTLMTCWPAGTSLKRLIVEATIQSGTNM